MPDAEIQLPRQPADPMGFMMTVEFFDDGVPAWKALPVSGEFDIRGQRGTGLEEC